MVSSKKVFCLTLIAILCFSQLALSVPKAQAYGMDAVFKDMSFGLLIGTIMGGLIMATNTNPNIKGEDWGRSLALGGAVGATVGLGIGMASTYKTALINLDGQEKIAFRLPKIKSSILTQKASMDVLSYSF